LPVEDKQEIRMRLLEAGAELAAREVLAVR